MERRELRIANVNVSTLALFEGLLVAVIGFAVSLAAWLGTGITYTADTATVLHGLLFGLSPGLLAVIVDTIIYFVAGWIVGLIHGGLFNLVSSWVGGLDVAVRGGNEFEEAPSAPMRARRAEPTFGETLGNRRIDR